MGTSKSLKPGSGGTWTSLKRKITGQFTGSSESTPGNIVGDTVRATGGVGIGNRSTATSSPATGAASAVGGLAGFAEAVRQLGLTEGVRRLGLDALSDKSALEIVSSIADHLARDSSGVDRDLMSDALRDSIIDAAALSDEGDFADLEAGLNAFIRDEGIEGLVELFLCRFVFDLVWANIEDHVQEKAPDEQSLQAFASAIEGICDTEVRSAIKDAKASHDFENVDWFGSDGQKLGQDVFSSVETKLRAMGG